MPSLVSSGGRTMVVMRVAVDRACSVRAARKAALICAQWPSSGLESRKTLCIFIPVEDVGARESRKTR